MRVRLLYDCKTVKTSYPLNTHKTPYIECIRHELYIPSCQVYISCAIFSLLTEVIPHAH